MPDAISPYLRRPIRSLSEYERQLAERDAKPAEPSYDAKCQGCMSFHWPCHCDVYDGMPLADASDCHGFLAKPRPAVLWDDAPKEEEAA